MLRQPNTLAAIVGKPWCLGQALEITQTPQRGIRTSAIPSRGTNHIISFHPFPPNTYLKEIKGIKIDGTWGDFHCSIIPKTGYRQKKSIHTYGTMRSNPPPSTVERKSPFTNRGK
jgi:hypothetical protein